jgi:hypothetical protein
MLPSSSAVKQWPRILGVITVLIGFPLTARADAGTPLMWAGLLHLVLGNALIGIFEGMILGWAFKLKKWRCVLAMIPANYFSAWVGGMFLNHEISAILPFDLYSAWRWIWVMVFETFLVTLLFEWPFVFFCFPTSRGRFKRSIMGNLLVNSLSYVLLLGWYWLASGTSLYTKMNVVPPSEIAFPKTGLVYFISSTNEVCKMDLSTRQLETVCPLQSGRDDRLFIRASAFGAGGWDILDSSKKTLICSNLQGVAVSRQQDTDDPGQIRGTWFNFDYDKIPRLGAAESSGWSFKTGFWPIEGLRGTNRATGQKIYFSLETPFVAWIVRNATQLPNDEVVFQLGDDQICLFEPSTKKIALLARGQGPVVVLPKN